MKNTLDDDLKETDIITNETTGQEFSVGEIKNSTRIVKSATPKGDLSWYIKWFSSCLMLLAVTLRASGVQELHIWDMMLSWVGAFGWFIVAFLWKDRALLLLNGVVCIVLFSGLIKYFFE